MKIESEIKKWGNSLALRVTGVMAEMPGFAAGVKVIVEVSEEGIIVKPAAPRQGAVGLPYSESSLLEGLTPATAHADELAEPGGKEFGD